jgi:hypothetical protein
VNPTAHQKAVSNATATCPDAGGGGGEDDHQEDDTDRSAERWEMRGDDAGVR